MTATSRESAPPRLSIGSMMRKRVRGVVSKYTSVPSTFEGWALRLMCAAVVVTLIASIMLMQQVSRLDDRARIAREERTTFQESTVAQMCAALVILKATPTQLKELQCSPK